MERDIRDNLKFVINDKCLVHSSIARKINMAPNKFSMIMHKNRKLEANEFLDICEAIDITPVELLEYPRKRGELAESEV